MTTQPLPQELNTSAEQKSRLPAALLAAGTAIVALGILAPQVPQTRDFMPEQVNKASDVAYSKVIGAILEPMITNDR